MEQTTVEPVAYSTVPNWIADKNFALASRAILKACQQYSLPKNYMVDLSQDMVLISEHKLSKFVYLLRDCGACVFAPLVLNGSRQAMMSSLKAYRAQHVDALWFTYDVDDIRREDDYNQPQLRLVTPAAAQEYLHMLYDESNEGVL